MRKNECSHVIRKGWTKFLIYGENGVEWESRQRLCDPVWKRLRYPSLQLRIPVRYGDGRGMRSLMNISKQTQRGLGVGVGILAGLVAAQAEVLTLSYNINPTTPNWSSTLNVNQFNPGWGALNSITFELKSGLSTDMSVVNAGGTAMAYSATLSSLVRVTPPSPNSQFSDSPTVTLSGTIPGGTQINQVGLSQILSKSSAMTDVAPFIGAGTVPVGVSGELPANAFVFTPANNQLVAGTFGNQTISALLNITYNYTPVPEAGTIAAGVALAGAAAWSLRRKTS